jgi:hypothetical protein
MVVWIILTTSLIKVNYERRRQEYIKGISSFLQVFKDPKYKIVIVENNTKINNLIIGQHKTFLDGFGVPVLYTKNNLVLNHTINYGIPEILDIFDCIKHFNIQDDDFIVKATGRYFLDNQSPFFEVVNNLEQFPYSAIVRFNQFDKPPSLTKTDSCTTGVIGLQCRYVKQIQPPPLDNIYISVEMKWAEVINKLDESQIYFLNTLGLFIKPMVLWKYDYIKI